MNEIITLDFHVTISITDGNLIFALYRVYKKTEPFEI